MGKADRRIPFEGGKLLCMLALRAAQYRIEHALGPGLFQRLGAADGFIDGGVGRDTREQQLVEANQQQRVQVPVGGLEWLLQQGCSQAIQALEPACSTEGELLGQALVPFVHMLQLGRQAGAQGGLAGHDRDQRVGCGQAWAHRPLSSCRPGANCSRRAL